MVTDFIDTGMIQLTPWANWTPTLTWGTAAPDSLTIIARWRRIAGLIFFHIDIYSADSNAASSLTITLPVAPVNNADRIRCASIERAGAAGATYSDPLAYIKADGSDNKINFLAFTTGTNAQAIAIIVSGVYEGI